MSETLSNLPTTTTRPSLRDIIPVTIGYGGPGTGVTYAVPIADILSADGLIDAGDPQFGGGVKADNTSDDTTPWTIVMQAAQNTGAWIIAPPGISLVSAFSVPDGVSILGKNVGSYPSGVGFQNLGTVIKGNSASNPTITLGQFTQLHNLQIIGTLAQPCVQISKGYVDLFDCTILGGSSGISYASGTLGHSRLLDLTIHSCGTAGILGAQKTTIAATNIAGCGTGILLTGGCNGVRLAGGNRIENNTNYGLSADGTSGGLRDLLVSGANSFDANGRANIMLRAVSASAISGGNSLSRGGQGQVGTPASADDCNLYMQNCNGVAVVGNTSRTGLNDAGTGYNSPYWAIYDGGGNVACIIASSIWAYHNNSTSATAGPINSTATFNLAAALNTSFWS